MNQIGRKIVAGVLIFSQLSFAMNVQAQNLNVDDPIVTGKSEVENTEMAFSLSTEKIVISNYGQDHFFYVNYQGKMYEKNVNIESENENIVKIDAVENENVTDKELLKKAPDNVKWYKIIPQSNGDTDIKVSCNENEKKIMIKIQLPIIEGNVPSVEESNQADNDDADVQETEERTDNDMIAASNEMTTMSNNLNPQTTHTPGWNHLTDGSYYFYDNGDCAKGITNIAGTLYCFDENSGVLNTNAGWVEQNEQKYFCNAQGIIYTNQLITFGDTAYYVGKSGSVRKGTIEYDGKIYHANESTGTITLTIGWIYDGDEKYFSGEGGVLYINQFISFGDIYYYMGGNGNAVKGLFQVDSSYYFANLDTAMVKKSSGWISNNDISYYADSEGKLYNGRFITVENNNYYMNENCSLQKGVFYIGNDMYWADAQSGVVTLTPGWHTSNDMKYFVGSSGTIYHNQFISFGDTLYYMGDDGSLQHGVINVNGIFYFSDFASGVIQKKLGWIQVDGHNKYFSNAEGHLYHDQVISFGNTSYYMGADGSIQKGVISINGKLYFAKKDSGIIQKKIGWIEDDGKKYFSNAEGQLYHNQIISFGNTSYYMGTDGSVQKGVIVVDDQLYYANMETGAISNQVGWIEYNGKKYFLSANGQLYKNQIISFGDIQYFMGSDGSIQQGIINVDNQLYYTSTDGVIQKKQGWIEYNGKKYFSNAKGILYQNQFISFGETVYYTGSDGSIQTGIIKEGNNVYYISPKTQTLQKKVGWFELEGKKYFSNENGQLYHNQIISFGNTEYYMGDDGSVQTGIITVGDTIYYAIPKTGVIQKKAGWIDVSGKTYYSTAQGVLYRNTFISFGTIVYYMGSDGSMQVGEQYINGKWYYFSENTGELVRSEGWFNSGTEKYYMKSNGEVATGYNDISGMRYFFDSEGKLSSKVCIDVSQWQGNINWSKVKSAGVDYAIIRVGYRGSQTGALASDRTYRNNIQGAINAGIQVGVYFFSQAINEAEAREEADYTYNLIKDFNITLPVAFDSEYYDSDRSGRADYLSSSTRTFVANVFCSRIAQYGYKPMIYASTYFFIDNLQFSLLSKNAEIWVAQYNRVLQHKDRYKCWQYSSSGSVSGISGNTDMNVWIN